MTTTRFITIAALVLLSANAGLARQIKQAATTATPTCPLPATQQIDFSPLSTAYGSTDTLCSTCICTVLQTLTPAFIAGGVTFDPTNSSSVDGNLIGDITTGCLSQYATEIATAMGASAANLGQLPNCPFLSATSTAAPPACIQTFVAGLPQPDSATSDVSGLNVTAGSDAATTTPDDTNATSTLGIISLGRPSDSAGPLFNITGNLTGNPATDLNNLLNAMAADQEFFSLMTDNEVALYNQVLANMTAISANPETEVVLAGLANPVDAVQLLTQLSKLADGTASVTATQGANNTDNATVVVLPTTTSDSSSSSAANASAVKASPAPKNSAAVAGTSAIATIVVAIMAAFLL